MSDTDHKKIDREAKKFAHLLPLTKKERKELEDLAKKEPGLREAKEKASKKWRDIPSIEEKKRKLAREDLRKAERKWREAAKAGLTLYQYGYADKPAWRVEVDEEAAEKLAKKVDRKRRTKEHRRKLRERMRREA